MNPRTLIHYLYPRLVALHDLDTEIALPQMVETPEGTVIERVRMPSNMRNSYHFMEASGVYLIGMLFCFPLLRVNVVSDNDENMVFWIGSSVSPQILSDLFGVDDVSAVNPRMVRFFCIACFFFLLLTSNSAYVTCAADNTLYPGSQYPQSTRPSTRTAFQDVCGSSGYGCNRNRV